MVDLPTPEDPSRTTVRPGWRYGAEGTRARHPATALDVSTGASPAMTCTSATRAGRSSHRSALLSSTTGAAPLAHVERQVSLQAPEVEVAGERRHDDDRVHVGDEDLLLGARQRCGWRTGRRARSGWSGAAPLAARHGRRRPARAPASRRPPGSRRPRGQLRRKPRWTSTEMSRVAVRARMASRAAPTTRAGNRPAPACDAKAVLAVLGPAQGREP